MRIKQLSQNGCASMKYKIVVLGTQGLVDAGSLDALAPVQRGEFIERGSGKDLHLYQVREILHRSGDNISASLYCDEILGAMGSLYLHLRGGVEGYLKSFANASKVDRSKFAFLVRGVVEMGPDYPANDPQAQYISHDFVKFKELGRQLSDLGGSDDAGLSIMRAASEIAQIIHGRQVAPFFNANWNGIGNWQN